MTRARSPRFLNLMWPLLGQGLGTHYYDNRAGMLDQFLVSKGLLTGKEGLKVDPKSVEILRFPGMVRSGNYPTPIRFGKGKSLNQNGYSDHLPIRVILKG